MFTSLLVAAIEEDGGQFEMPKLSEWGRKYCNLLSDGGKSVLSLNVNLRDVWQRGCTVTTNNVSASLNFPLIISSSVFLTNALRQQQYVVIHRVDRDSIRVGGPMSASGHRNSAFLYLYKRRRLWFSWIMSELCAASCGGFQYINVWQYCLFLWYVLCEAETE